MKHQDLTREELFALVWNKPMTKVAGNLKISDVYLKKLCTNLQVPTPPRGYWAKLKAGNSPKKPPLKAFKDEFQKSVQKIQQKDPKTGLYEITKLTNMQRGFFQNAISTLTEAGVDTSSCKILHSSVRGLSKDLATQILILVQNQFEKWLPEDSTSRKLKGGHLCSRKIYEKLIPIAKTQVIIIEEDSESTWQDHKDCLILHITPALLHLISSLHNIVLKNKLSYVAREIDNHTHAWSIRHYHSDTGYGNSASEIHVSKDSVWIRSTKPGSWSDTSFTTKKISIKRFIPDGLLPLEFKELPVTVRGQGIRPFDDRIKALVMAEKLFDDISNAFYEIEDSSPKQYIALVENVWKTGSGLGPFSVALEEKRQMEKTLNELEETIELEKAQLVQEILGLEIADNILFEKNNQAIRLCVQYTSLSIYETEIIISLTGQVYRKDGILGKRTDSCYLHIPRTTSLE